MCSVDGCRNSTIRSRVVKLYDIPSLEKDQDSPSKYLLLKRRKKWIEALQKCGLNTEGDVDSYKVCSIHFVNKRPAELSATNDVDWIPTRYLALKRRRMDDSDEETCENGQRRCSTRRRNLTKNSKLNSDFIFLDVESAVNETLKKDDDQLNSNSQKKVAKNAASQTAQLSSNYQPCLGEIIEYFQQVLDYTLNANGAHYRLKQCNLLFEQKRQILDNEESTITIRGDSKLESENEHLLEYAEKCCEFYAAKKNSVKPPGGYLRTHCGKKENIFKKENNEKSKVSDGVLDNLTVIDISDEANVEIKREVDGVENNRVPEIELTRLSEISLEKVTKSSSENVKNLALFSVNNLEDDKDKAPSKILLVPYKSKNKLEPLNQNLQGYLVVSKNDPTKMAFLPKESDVIQNAKSLRSFQKQQENGNENSDKLSPKMTDCNVCRKVFMKLGSLPSHLKTHKEYFKWKVECKNCPKRFLNEELLEEHLEEYHTNQTRKVFCRSCLKMILFYEYQAGHLEKCEEEIKLINSMKNVEEIRLLVNAEDLNNEPNVKTIKVEGSFFCDLKQESCNEIIIEEVDSE